MRIQKTIRLAYIAFVITLMLSCSTFKRTPEKQPAQATASSCLCDYEGHKKCGNLEAQMDRITPGCVIPPWALPVPPKPVPAVWINPIAKTKLNSTEIMSLKNDLEQCAETLEYLPGSCKAGEPDKFVTTTKSFPISNCHWQCGRQEGCAEGKCLWEVKVRGWSLEHKRLTRITKVGGKACGKQWEETFARPDQYEETTCETECFQLRAVTSLSKTNPECAMEVLGLIAQRPACFGTVPDWCKSGRNKSEVE